MLVNLNYLIINIMLTLTVDTIVMKDCPTIAKIFYYKVLGVTYFTHVSTQQHIFYFLSLLLKTITL